MKQKDEDFATRLSNLKDHVNLSRKSEKTRLLESLNEVQKNHEKFAADVDRASLAGADDKLKPQLSIESEQVDAELKQLERHFKH